MGIRLILSQKEGVLFGSNTVFIVESVIPDFFVLSPFTLEVLLSGFSGRAHQIVYS